MQAIFAKRVSKRSDELSSHDFAEFKLVVNFNRNIPGDSLSNPRKMRHVIPGDKRAQIISR